MNDTIEKAQLTNPYKHPDGTLIPQDVIRISIDVDRRDVNRIKLVTLDGTLPVALAMCVRHLAEYAERNNLSAFNATDKQHFIKYIERTLGDPGYDVGLPVNQPGGQRPHGDDRPGTNGVRPDDTTAEDKSTTRRRKQTSKKTGNDGEGVNQPEGEG